MLSCRRVSCRLSDGCLRFADQRSATLPQRHRRRKPTHPASAPCVCSAYGAGRCCFARGRRRHEGPRSGIRACRCVFWSFRLPHRSGCEVKDDAAAPHSVTTTKAFGATRAGGPLMNITRVSVYQVDVPIKPATISHSRVMSVFDETRGRPVCRHASRPPNGASRVSPLSLRTERWGTEADTPSMVVVHRNSEQGEPVVDPLAAHALVGAGALVSSPTPRAQIEVRTRESPDALMHVQIRAQGRIEPLDGTRRTMALMQHRLDGIEQHRTRGAELLAQCPISSKQMTRQRTIEGGSAP